MDSAQHVWGDMTRVTLSFLWFCIACFSFGGGMVLQNELVKKREPKPVIRYVKNDSKPIPDVEPHECARVCRARWKSGLVRGK